MDDIRASLKKLVLAGVGAAAAAAEKGRDALDALSRRGAKAVDEFSRKGEETVEKGKAAGEDLKASLIRKYEALAAKAPKSAEEVGRWVDGLTDDARRKLYDFLNAQDEAECCECEPTEADEACGETPDPTENPAEESADPEKEE